MRIPRIYLAIDLTPGAIVTLDDNAFNHVVRALRLKDGADIILFNGQGGEYSASLEQVDRKRASARVGAHRSHECESPLRIVLAQSISRGDKMDYTIQKAVELGVNAIVPLFSERCGVKLDGDRLDKRIEHWQGVAASACEQCGRNQVPHVHAAQTLADWLPNTAGEHRLVLAPTAAHNLHNLDRPSGEITLLMGPEGGLSDEEIELAIRHGFHGIRLGPRVLRTETAGLTALSAIQTLWGDLA